MKESSILADIVWHSAVEHSFDQGGVLLGIKYKSFALCVSQWIQKHLQNVG